MSRRLTCHVALLVVGALVAPTAGRAQWSVSAEVGAVTTASTTYGFAPGAGTPSVFDLNHGAEGRASIWRQAGPWRFSAGVSRVSHERLIRDSGLTLGADGVSSSRTELGPTVGHKLVQLGGGGAIWLDVGPTLAIWSPSGGTSRTRVGGLATLAAEWPVAGPLLAVFRFGVAVSASPDQLSDFDTAQFQPVSFETAWRRWTAAGLRLRL